MYVYSQQLSQFWYNNETKQILSSICSKLVHNKREQKIEPINIALISCPSIYELVKSYVRNVANIRLFEFDMRFSTFGDDFVYYDYKDECNESISKIYQRTFDILIADPPFLSEECIIKYSNFIKVLQKDNSNVVLCSGQTVSGWIEEALHLHQCKFHPEHENNLANQFRCYANFDLDTLL